MVVRISMQFHPDGKTKFTRQNDDDLPFEVIEETAPVYDDLSKPIKFYEVADDNHSSWAVCIRARNILANQALSKRTKSS